VERLHGAQHIRTRRCWRTSFGARALAAHGQVRATRDLNVWMRCDRDNASRVMAALKDFGAALHDRTTGDLATPGTVFQMGVAPVRIDRPSRRRRGSDAAPNGLARAGRARAHGAAVVPSPAHDEGASNRAGYDCVRVCVRGGGAPCMR
jgi:hypothetical protein